MIGMSLPSNVLVYVILGIICLLAIFGLMYWINSNPNWNALYSSACLKLYPECSKNLGEVIIRSRGKTYSLAEICEKLGMSEEECRRGCGCE